MTPFDHSEVLLDCNTFTQTPLILNSFYRKVPKASLSQRGGRRAATHLWDVDSGPEELQMLPHLLRFELGIENGELGEHAHVGALQAQRGLQQGDELLEVASVLVVADQVLQLVGVDHDVKAADLCKTEFLAVHARKAHLSVRGKTITR